MRFIDYNNNNDLISIRRNIIKKSIMHLFLFNASQILHFSLVLLSVVVFGYFMIELGSTSSPAYAQFLSSGDDKSPVFLESYWTTSSESSSSQKTEVGPGEGPSTLSVILANTGRSQITGLKGFLSLPGEFRSIPGENNVTSSNVAVASHNSVVKPGESFSLPFTVDVLQNATVGPYSANLTLVYSKVQEIGQVTTNLVIPYRVTGKVILDTASLTQNLTTGTSNKITLAIKNKGSADANGVIATITNLNGGTITNVQSSEAGSENNENGNISETRSTLNGSSASSGEGGETADTMPGNESKSTSNELATTLQATTFNIGTIKSASLVTINPILYADYASGGTIQTMNLKISYNDAYGNKKSSNTLIGLVVSPNPPESKLSVLPAEQTLVNLDNDTSTIPKSEENSIIISSGKIEKMDFVVNNTGGKSLNDVLLSLSSSSDSVKILGDSRWTIPVFLPYEEKKLSTIVFASDDVISKPVSFAVDANYISGGKTQSDQMSLGAYIEGQIKVTAYDVAINEIGGVPNFVGNLLNEGNTMAFFTRIQVVESDTSNVPALRVNNSSGSSDNNNGTSTVHNLFLNNPPSQYLGDLTENSPLPFGIPINITENTPKGEYPISLVITYKDNLRNDHKLTLNETVDYKPRIQSSSGSSNGIFGLDSKVILIMAIVIVVVVVIAVIFIIRRKKRKQVPITNNEDLNDRDNPDDHANNNLKSTLFDNDNDK